jgi:hypothetical protein
LTSKKYDELRAAADQAGEPLVRTAWRFTANLYGGHLEEAEADLQALPAKIRGMDALCLSIAWRNAHRDDKADECLKEAIQLLSDGSPEHQIVAGWLREPPADLTSLLPKITDLSFEPDDKVIVLLALASGNRPGREQLVEFAKRLNAWPGNRNAFVEATLAAMH